MVLVCRTTLHARARAALWIVGSDAGRQRLSRWQKLAPIDEFYLVTGGSLKEADADIRAASWPHRRDYRLDAFVRERRKHRIEIIDNDRDVPRAHISGPRGIPLLIHRQLDEIRIARQREIQRVERAEMHATAHSKSERTIESDFWAGIHNAYVRVVQAHSLYLSESRFRCCSRAMS